VRFPTTEDANVRTAFMGPSSVSSSNPNLPLDVTPEELTAGASLLERLPTLSAELHAPPSAVESLVGRHPSPAPSLPPLKKDWCGSDGSEWVPDGALGVDWSDACRTHDECYATPGANKFLCDYTLQQDMSLACAAQDGGIPCQILAGIYFHGVRTPQGEEAFERAQAAAGAKAQ
jgi:hypothetical protein